MVVVLIFVLIVLWAIIQANIVETTGQAPRTRSSMRHQRRKASKLGMDPEEVPYTPRDRPLEPFKLSRRANAILLGLTVLIWTLLLFPWDWLKP